MIMFMKGMPKNLPNLMSAVKNIFSTTRSHFFAVPKEQLQYAEQIQLLKAKYPKVIDKELLESDLQKSEYLHKTFSKY